MNTGSKEQLKFPKINITGLRIGDVEIIPVALVRERFDF